MIGNHYDPPPSAAAQTPSGTGKFVIFTREEVGREGEWDFIAGAWECIPSRPDVPVTKRVRLTVANRANMRFRMLLGRQALLGDFLVDVSQKYLLKKS